MNQTDRISLLKNIENFIIDLSCDKIGTYPIQSIIEKSKSKIEKVLISQNLENKLEILIFNQYGCHVIEKLLSHVEEEYISKTYKYIIDNFLSLSYHVNGIYVVKTFLTLHIKNVDKEKIKLIIKEN